MADRCIETLSIYLQGSKPLRKTQFCEPHPHRFIHILFNIILIIGQITSPMGVDVCGSSSMFYSQQNPLCVLLGSRNSTQWRLIHPKAMGFVCVCPGSRSAHVFVCSRSVHKLSLYIQVNGPIAHQT